jgi:hypothetical protein
VHNPPVTLLGMNEAQLDAELIGDKPAATKTVGRTKPRGTAAQPTENGDGDLSWPQKIAAADPGSKNEAWAKSDFDDRKWKTMKLPVHFEQAGLPDYDGVVWFRTTIDLPAGTTGAGKLGLGAIDDMDVTWVNGTRVGGYEAPGHHFTKRNYAVPAGVLKPGRNVIAVRVMDHGWGGGISGQTANPKDLKLSVGGTVIKLDTEWRYRAGANLATLNAVTATTATATAAAASGDRLRAFTGGFQLAKDDVITLMGGTNALKQLDHGYFETLLTRAAGGKPVYFRNMAWQADTVYRQQRPRSFGSHLEHLERVDASVVIMHFGQVESMDGTEQLQAFIEHYGKLLTEVQARTKKVVLVTPLSFQKSTHPHLPDLTRHNAAVAAYAEAIRKLAAERDCMVVDLSTSPLADGAMSDGMHLTAAGQHEAAGRLCTALLGADVAKGAELTKAGAFQNADLEKLRQSINAKNELWFRHWRPSNWGFLYGNRQHVPSSRDHRDHKKRWFPDEINGILVLLEKAEDEIHGVTE